MNSNKTIRLLLGSLLIFGSCQFSKTTKIDLTSGLVSKGDKLTCDDVYLSVNNSRTTRNTFIYGETFFMNFSDIKGFTGENNKVFPGMILSVLNTNGDTIMKTDDLMSKYPDGMSFSPLSLTADLTVAAPIQSKREYSAVVNIWDRKGDGRFTAEFDFKVVENDKITIETSSVSYGEVYVFSQGNDRVITDNKIKFNDNIYFIIEGLKGFKENDNNVFPGLRLKATDSANNVIVQNDDLFTDYNDSGLAASDLAERVSAHFNVPSTPQFNNPMHCELTLWDKKSDARITVNVDLVIE